ncbi:MAG: 2-dehydro-3-deoxy-6-phosphogalactonate aldolase [Alphaproteobacteria bacterium]|nr:MAG: 2-dehydro-3-deoxy-6-phosphogalactonate aldolase [Alphaproteobacteria bacterium]
MSIMINQPDRHLKQLPLVAILRGLRPEEALDIGKVLFDAGFRAIEVPLNSPDPFRSIERLARHFGEDCLVGAGTVTQADQVGTLYDAGGRLVVSPCTDTGVIRAANQRGMLSLPGVATPTEVFNAIHAGAKYLKLFPASTYGTGHLKALKAVVPAGIEFIAVGGVGPANMAEWSAAGSLGFGLGSDLYKAGMPTTDVAERARASVAAFAACHPKSAK